MGLRDDISDSLDDFNVKHLFESVSRWSSSDGQIFFPTATHVNKLPSAVFSPGIELGQLCLIKINIDTQELLELPDSTSNLIIEEVRSFWNKKDLYLSNNIQYKRGILMYGPPGSGKSCTIKLLINDVIKLGGLVILLDDIEIGTAALQLIRKIEPETPIIAVIEDVDRFTNSDEFKLISLLDGVSAPIENIVFLATTNYPENLPKRLINRPSRFDKRFMIDYPNTRARTVYLQHLFSQATLQTTYPIKRWVQDTTGLSLAHIKELFVAVTIIGNPYKEALQTIKEMMSDPELSDESDFE